MRKVRRDTPTVRNEARIRRDPDILDADEVAEMLGVSRGLVYDGAGRGEIPCRRVGRRLLFSRRAIVAWLERAGEERHTGPVVLPHPRSAA